MLQDIGLLVLTDLTIETRPCRRHYYVAYNSEFGGARAIAFGRSTLGRSSCSSLSIYDLSQIATE